MLIALLSDIHANREALDACLADIAASGVDSIVFLGDLVGYGPDPVYVIERVAGFVEAGSLAILGNHDAAAVHDLDNMNAVATAAIRWTQQQLSSQHLAFLAGLPLDYNEDDRLYVHASADDPEDWHYVTGVQQAGRSFAATAQRLTFCGHTHVPALFAENASGMPHRHVPVDDVAMPLLKQRRWVAVLGAVGQPRDHNPAACYGLIDTEANRLTYRRVAYDVDVTSRKIRAAGLPELLATRILTGD